jgi:hypothetical protein
MHTMKLNALVGMLTVNFWCIWMCICAYVHDWICMSHACGLRIVCCYIHAIMMLWQLNMTNNGLCI